MRLTSFSLTNTAGIGHVEVSELSDVVVLAGPNGVGKTRIMDALIKCFRNPRKFPDIRIKIEATSASEFKAWGKASLDTNNPEDAGILNASLQKTQRRNQYRSTVLNFDSDRAITNIQPFNFSWDISDPFEEEVAWDVSYNFLRDRFNDVRHSLFRLVETQRRKISERAVLLRTQGETSMPLDFSDPIQDFKAAFHQLLAPKTLADVNTRAQQINFEIEGERFPIEKLSSGEKEVVNIVFDFILRRPSDCIVMFDEPELHLHPELSYKLLQTLTAIGKNNQFIFCTHSPEIITASIENSVVFLTPKKPNVLNQAILVNRDDATNNALNLLGQSIGIISLGKKLLLIEGTEASLDKQTYGAILRNEFPELVLVPVGGKNTIRSFDEVVKSVLNQTIWGVEFFMLCDRDAVYDMGPRSSDSRLSGRLKMLPRYHLENYFLDEEVLGKVFSDMEPKGSHFASAIRNNEMLREIAAEAVPFAVALKVSATLRERIGNVDVMPKGIDKNTTLDDLLAKFRDRAASESARVAGNLNLAGIEDLARAEYADLMKSVVEDTSRWKVDLPGKLILKRFAGRAGIQAGRLKALYLKQAHVSSPSPFSEIRTLFQSFYDIGKVN